MRTLTALTLAFASLFGAASAHATVTARQAAAYIKPALQASKLVSDKSTPYKTTLGALKAGTKNVRLFTATNVHSIAPHVNGPFQPHFMMEVGGVARGQIDLRNGKVKVTNYSLVR